MFSRPEDVDILAKNMVLYVGVLGPYELPKGAVISLDET